MAPEKNPLESRWQRAWALGSLSDHQHQIRALEPSLLLSTSLSPSFPCCQICREIALGRGTQGGSCSWELGQQIQKGKLASLGPQSQGASQLAKLSSHKHTNTHTAHMHAHAGPQGDVCLLWRAVSRMSTLHQPLAIPAGWTARRFSVEGLGDLVTSLLRSIFHTCLIVDMG